MAIDLSGLQTFTLAEQLAVVEATIINLQLTGKQWMINGTQVTRADLPELIAWRDKLKTEIAIDGNGDNGTIALVQFGDRS